MISEGRSEKVPNLTKNTTSTYTYHKLFENINISEQISKNKHIQRCPEDLFIYNILEKKTVSRHNFKLDKIYYDNLFYKEVSLLDEFDIIIVIGEGSFGMVVEDYDKTLKKKAALKIVKKENSGLYQNEAKQHMHVNHTHIVKLLRWFENEDFLFLLMELMEGGTPKNLIIHRYNE